LPGTDEVSGNVTVDGQHHDADEDCWIVWRTIAVTQTVPQFGFGVVFSLLLKLTFLLFMLAYWLLLCCQICNIHQLGHVSTCRDQSWTLGMILEVYMVLFDIFFMISCSHASTLWPVSPTGHSADLIWVCPSV
jgi:hypothetical protein